MRRGEVWTSAGGKDYARKPRPVVVVQDDRFDTELSITVCGFTTDPTSAAIFRLPIEPNRDNGLSIPSVIMVDKISTVPRRKLARRIGFLNAEQMLRLNEAIIVFLGLASRHRPGS